MATRLQDPGRRVHLRQGITVATKTKLEESLMIATPRYADPEAIVSTAWLAEHLPDPALRIYDCTTYLHYETGTGRPYRLESGRADYEQAHIPGSAFLDFARRAVGPGSPHQLH